jgi:hypothetical protein
MFIYVAGRKALPSLTHYPNPIKGKQALIAYYKESLSKILTLYVDQCSRLDHTPGMIKIGKQIVYTSLTWHNRTAFHTEVNTSSLPFKRSEMKAEILRNHPITKNEAALEQIEARLTSTKTIYKNHQRAKQYGTSGQKAFNPVVQGMYFAILKKTKELYKGLPSKEDRIIIELNNEQDPTDSHGLFTLLTPSFFFYLECDIKNNYRIEYLFHDCPVEQEIQKLIDRFAMRSYSTETVKQPDYPTFFRQVLSCQPDRFIHHL